MRHSHNRYGITRWKERRRRDPEGTKAVWPSAGVPHPVNSRRSARGNAFVAVLVVGVILVCGPPRPPAEPLPLSAAAAVSAVLAWWRQRGGAPRT